MNEKVEGVRQEKYRNEIKLIKDKLSKFEENEKVGILHEIFDDTPYKTRDYDKYSHDEYYIVHNKKQLIEEAGKKFKLKPKEMTKQSITSLIKHRKSLRDYSNKEVDFETFSTIIHYTFGLKNIESGIYNEKFFPFKYVNSQGGLNYLDMYIIVNGVEKVPDGLYYYDFLNNQICLIEQGHMRTILSEIHFANEFVAYGAFSCFIIADLSRVMPKYYKRAYRMAHVDSGIVIGYLQLLAEASGIHSCVVAGFLEHKLDKLLHLAANEIPIISVTFGEKYYD